MSFPRYATPVLHNLVSFPRYVTPLLVSLTVASTGVEIPILVADGDLVRLEQGTLHSTTETLSLLQSTGLVMYSNQRQAL